MSLSYFYIVLMIRYTTHYVWTNMMLSKSVWDKISSKEDLVQIYVDQAKRYALNT
jgi:hypothetical protein